MDTDTKDYIDYLKWQAEADKNIVQLKAEHDKITQQLDNLHLQNQIGQAVRAAGGSDEIANLVAPLISSHATKKLDGTFAIGQNQVSIADAISDLRSNAALANWMKPQQPTSSLSPEGFIRQPRR